MIVIGGQPRWARSLSESLDEHGHQPTMTVLRPEDVWRAPTNAAWIWVGYRPGAHTLRGCVFDTAAVAVRTLRRPRRWIHYWIGTDVHNALHETVRWPRSTRLQRAEHIAAAPWLTESLAEIGVAARTIPFPVPLPEPQPPAIGLRPPVLLSYVPDARPGFYGGPQLLDLARRTPVAQLRIMGGRGTWASEVPPNVTFLGWTDAKAEYAKARVVLRLVEHDAIGGTVREGLAAGLQVIYTYDYPGCRFVSWPLDPVRLDAAVSAALAVDSYNELGIRQVVDDLDPVELVRRLSDFLCD